MAVTGNTVTMIGLGLLLALIVLGILAPFVPQLEANYNPGPWLQYALVGVAALLAIVVLQKLEGGTILDQRGMFMVLVVLVLLVLAVLFLPDLIPAAFRQSLVRLAHP